MGNILKIYNKICDYYVRVISRVLLLLHTRDIVPKSQGRRHNKVTKGGGFVSVKRLSSTANLFLLAIALRLSGLSGLRSPSESPKIPHVLKY